MTAETDPLPLPKPLPRVLVHVLHEGDMELEAVGNYYNAEQVRPCVSSATEALRAEVALLRVGAENERLHASTLLRQERERAERLAEALRWALPLASQGLEMCRLERLRCGHGDITGTYKNGETWAGIHQEEVDGLERARAALEQEAGRE